VMVDHQHQHHHNRGHHYVLHHHRGHYPLGDGAAAVARLANVQHRIACVAAVKDAPRIPVRDWGHAFGGETTESLVGDLHGRHARPASDLRSGIHSLHGGRKFM
jgi:hypothetical protein